MIIIFLLLTSESDVEEKEQQKQNVTKVMTLEEEQRLLKEEFIKAAETSLQENNIEKSNDVNDAIERDSGFLKQRKKTAAELEKEENEYQAFLKQQEERV
jgi:hypothetical protein